MAGDISRVVLSGRAPSRVAAGSRVVVGPGAGTTFDGCRRWTGLTVAVVENGRRRRRLTTCPDRGIERAAQVVRERAPPVVWLEGRDRLVRALPAATAARLERALVAAVGDVDASLVVWTGRDEPTG